MHIFDHIYQYFVISLAYLFIYTRWFTVTFSSPSWRSLNPLKGSLNHPKKGTLNHQVYIPSLTALRHNVFPRFFAPKWHIHGANQRPRHPKAPPRRSPTAHQRTVDGWPRFPPPTKKKTKEREHETKKHVKNLDLDFEVDFFLYFLLDVELEPIPFFLGLDGNSQTFFCGLRNIVGRSAIFLCQLSCHPKNRPVHDHSIFQLQRLVQGTFILPTMLHMWAPLWNQKLVTVHSFCYLRARSLL